MNQLNTLAFELSAGAEPEITISIDAILPIKHLQIEFAKFFDPQVLTSLKLHIDILESTLYKVLSHECDFAIGSYFDESSDVDAIHFVDTLMVPVIATSKFDAGIDLKSFPQIIISSSGKKKSDKIIGGLPRGKKWFTSDISMKLELIKYGLGWGRLPQHLVAQLIDQKVLTNLDGFQNIMSLNVPLYLIKSKTYKMGPNAKRLWDRLIRLGK